MTFFHLPNQHLNQWYLLFMEKKIITNEYLYQTVVVLHQFFKRSQPPYPILKLLNLEPQHYYNIRLYQQLLVMSVDQS